MLNKLSFAILTGASFILFGCASTWEFNSNADEKFPAKNENCNIKIMNTLPKEGYTEIGTLNVSGGRPQKNVQEFRETIRKQVCAAGGDLVVGEINGVGWYMKGIVFRKDR